MIHVPDVRATVDWYRNVGFDVISTYGNGADGLDFAMLSFGAGEVMFSSGGRSSPRHRREVDLYGYTSDVDALHERVKTHVEVVEGPHNMFYGMREVIIRDLNGFWVTFGQEIPAEQLTPWPAVAPELLQPYAGRYKADEGLAVLVTIHGGRLLAFPDDAPGVFLRPEGEHTFKPTTPEDASVTFEVHAGAAAGLVFTQGAMAMRLRRIEP